MKHHLRFTALALGLMFFGSVAQAQNNGPKKTTAQHETEKAQRVNNNVGYFDEEKAIEDAKKKNMPAGDIPGYVQTLKREHNAKQVAAHHHDEPKDVYSAQINLSTQNSYCTNAGFELYNFTNWAGSSGSVSVGPAGGQAVYTPTLNAISNSGGNNTSLADPTNYHTIMTTPAVQPIFPNTVGYDSIAVRQVGAQLISDIPVVNPNSGGGVSARMNGALANYRACKLTYNMALNPNNRRFTYSFAVVLYDGGHASEEQPFFQVAIKDQNGNPIGGSCGIYSINATLAGNDTSFRVSDHPSSFSTYLYRPWKTYSIDLSGPAYASVTSINVEYTVAGCAQGGHWAYAYVDADCGAAGATASLCNGATTAVLVAPPGYVTYQWIDPFGTPVAAPQGTNDSLTVNGATPGMTYTVVMTTPNNCTVSLTTTISITTVSITGTTSSPSCQNGNSGTAGVIVTGSNFPYVFQWTNGTSVVSTAQTATGLSPGNYTVNVTSGSCGSATGTVAVGISPPSFYSVPAPFCGNIGFIPKPGGNTYQWYSVSGSAATPISAPQGNNDTLFVNSPAPGDVYILTYTNPTGCRDSIRYVMNQIPGGSIYTSSIQGVCPGNSNGVGVINLQTTEPGPFNYIITGPNGYYNTLNGTAIKDSLTGLAIGTYTALVNDGVCFYTTNFNIDVITTNFSAIPSNSVACINSDTAVIDLSFGAQPPSACGITGTACTSPNNIQLFNTPGLPSNGTTNFPTPYGNWYTYGKQQYLVSKADLNAAGITAGKISSLAFKVTGMNSSISNYPNFSIRMGCTNLSNLSNASPIQFETAGLYQVYSNANQPVSLGWNVHNFQQSFVWDGNSNIVVEVCFGMNTSSSWTQNVSVELKQTTYTAAIWSMSDSQSQCPQTSGTGIGTDYGNNPAFNTLSQYIPNMRFGYCLFAPPASAFTITAAPGTYTLVNNNNQIKVSPTFTAPPATNTVVSYTITVINPIGGCVADTVVDILYPSLNTDATTSNDTTVCEGTTLPIKAWNAASYAWTYALGSTLVPVGSTPTVYVTPPSIGPNTYYVNATGYCSPTNDIDTVIVTVKPKSNLLLAPILDAVKCLNKPYSMTAVVGPADPNNPGSPYYYSWTDYPSGTPSSGSNNGATYTILGGATTSTYVVTAYGACAHAISDTIVVTNLPNTLAVSTVDSIAVCSGSPILINSAVSNGYAPYSYNWVLQPAGTSIGGGSALSTNAPLVPSMYTIQLDVSDTCGYLQSETIVLNVLPPCGISIPNVITPNGDGKNEAFHIDGLDQHPNCSLTIFDRWGRKVYESDNYQNDWKGDGVSDGTFFYVLKVPNDDKNYSGYLSVFHGK